VSVNRVTAAGGSRKNGGGKNRKRVERLVYVETKTVTVDGRDVEVGCCPRAAGWGSARCRQRGPVFVPLERIRTHRNADKCRTYRWYNDYRLPERLGGGVVTVRLHANAEDV
jgi:TPP-dependent pyruvate/acetoin dehydrogenase alpha subunit